MHVRRRVAPVCMLVGLVGAMAVPVAGHGQSLERPARAVVAALSRQDGAPASQLHRAADRLITLDLHDVTLKTALQAIARQGEVALFYNDRDLPAERRVSVRVSDATVTDVVQLVLRGTGLVAHTTAAGVVIRRRERPERSEPRAQEGAIRGTVTDSATHAPVDGATVVVNGGELQTVTDAAGAYRLAEVPAGTVTLTVRRLGYVAASREVTVIADSETVVDVRLVAAPQMLEEVVTTGTVVPTAVKALPTPISVITASDIEDQPAPRLSQLFRQAVPGAVAPDAGVYTMQTALSVRGAASLLGAAGAGTLKIYIDGIEVANKTLAGVDPSSVDRIEVIRGPEAAAIYGSDAIGGVLQIFTKHGSLDQHPQANAQMALGMTQSPYGDRNALRQEYTASVNGGGTAISYSVGGSYTREGDWLPAYFLSQPSAHGGLRVVQDRFTLDLSARYTDQRIGRPIDPRLTQTGLPSVAKPYYYNSSQPTATYGAHITYRPWTWWRHSLTLGTDGFTYDEHSTRPRLTTPADTLLYLYFSKTQKVSVAYNTSVTAHLAPEISSIITLGVDHYDLTNTFAYTTGANTVNGTIATVPGMPLSGGRDLTHNSGYFVQGQLNIHDALFLTAAIRAEHNSNLGDELGTPFSPRGGISYVRSFGAATVKFRASYGEAISPPTPGRKRGAVYAGQIQRENLLLGPERQAGGDAGVDLIFGSRGSLSITGYDQTADGLIQQVVVDATSAPITVQYQNVGRVKNRGLEVEGALHWRWGDLTAQYAFTRSRVDALGADYSGELRVGDQSLLVPRHTAGVSVLLRPFRRTTLQTWFNYVGARTEPDVLGQLACLGHTGPCASSARDYLTTYAPFLQTSVTLTHDFTPSMTAFVSVQNVANQLTNQLGNTIASPGRITLAGVRVRAGLR